jgi:hypothetical protein
MAAALPRAEASVLKKLFALALVVLAAGIAGGWLLFERDEDDDEDEPALAAQPGLPESVARKRAEVWSAARAKDYDALGRLVDPDQFTYTFGGPVPGGPAAYWRRLEETSTERPIETLAAILRLPSTKQRQIYVWPYAFTRRASTLSAEEKEQLAEAIGDEGLRQYLELGDYLSYRAGIDANGAWVFYVAGD